VEVLLIRHGNAGSKARWAGDDRDRPLSVKGTRQAKWLVDAVVPFSPRRIVSSPYLRCRETVAPMADKLGIPVVTEEALVPDADEEATAYVERIGRSRQRVVVLCTHGEVIGQVLGTLAGSAGVKLRPKPPGQKGGLWVLDMRAGRLVRARYTPPG
jgi:8-oxo-dGTP diphosphatase